MTANTTNEPTQERSAFQTTIDKIARQRDELRLTMHLAKAEAQAEWEKAEAKWRRVQGELDKAREGSSEAFDKVREGLHDVVNEIQETYDKIRATVSS